MDETFSRWLAIREPADAAARSGDLTRAISDALPKDRPLHILDLGTGTGSNVRFLIERLPPRQRWLLVDRDDELLTEAPARIAEWATASGHQARTRDHRLVITGGPLDCRIETRRLDLNAFDPQLFAGQDLVTGSALLDLVSDRWLQDLAAACAANGAKVLFALSYNGRSGCTPEEPEDERIRQLMNEHQQGDKGFGAAAGPAAAERAMHAFERAGYVVRRETSDWRLPPDAVELQVRLLQGWHEAAIAAAPDDSLVLHDWLARRLAHVNAGRSTLMVGHEDLAAWPVADP